MLVRISRLPLRGLDTSSSPARDKMKVLALSLAASIAWPAATQAQTQDPPFYAAFRAICGDTGADPKRVKAAIAAAPFPKRVDPPISSSLFPSLTMTTATINWNGHRLSIQSSRNHMPIGGGTSTDVLICSIVGSDHEDVGLAAVRKWVGVQPTSTIAAFRITNFDYRQDGSVRTPLVGDAASNAAIVQGKYWSVRLNALGIYRAQLFHFLAPAPQKAK
jgi:hypothetical protein